jgi:hypothetical protein
MVKQCLDCKIEINNHRRRCVKCKTLFDNVLKKKYIQNNRVKHNLVSNLSNKKHKDRRNKYMLRYTHANLDKRYARSAARYVTLSITCDICDSREDLTHHHWRYDKPLLVNTLCKFCHNVQHGRSFYE